MYVLYIDYTSWQGTFYTIKKIKIPFLLLIVDAQLHKSS